MKLPYHWSIDAFLKRNGTICAFAELKCRTHPSTQYPSTMVGMKKLTEAFKLQSHLGKLDGGSAPVILFIRFTDKDMWGIVDKTACCGYEVKEVQAHNHYGHPRDRNEMVFIPLDGFKEF